VWEKPCFFPSQNVKKYVFFITGEKPGFWKKEPTNLRVLDALGKIK
jgi:hypothetical protein